VREIDPDAKIQTFINDDPLPRQSDSINQMVFSPTALIAYISEIMTLLPGDVILTGTPAGIGAMLPGDRVRVEISGVGRLENYLVAPGQSGAGSSTH
jgi:2-keto-4-pentenoate hydratase/2-oxohepta-3-ene-1,7-dioic acid hydratase in catechol pathway